MGLVDGFVVIALLIVIIGAVFWVTLELMRALSGNHRLAVSLQNGLPYCPKCKRQVSLRRTHCRACGHDLRVQSSPQRSTIDDAGTIAYIADVYQSHLEDKHPDWRNMSPTLRKAALGRVDRRLRRELKLMNTQYAEYTAAARQRLWGERESPAQARPQASPGHYMASETPISHWEQMHREPSDVLPRLMLRQEVEELLSKRLMGDKMVDVERITDTVVLRRSSLQYEAKVSLYAKDDRHGFEVDVPLHGFKVRITIPRIIPPGVADAPWEDLLECLCKIDRSVIKGRNASDRPLVYGPVHGPHPLASVEVLSRKRIEGPA